MMQLLKKLKNNLERPKVIHNQSFFDTHTRLVISVLIGSLSLCAASYGEALTLTETGTVSLGAQVGLLPSVDGGGSGGVVQSGVRFSGYAYPNARVVVQSGLQNIATLTADASGYFSLLIPGTNSQLFSLYAVDVTGQKSTLLNFPTVLYSGYLTDITGILFAPTIVSDKVVVTKDDFIRFSGYGRPNKDIEIVLDGPETRTFLLTTNTQGFYTITAPVTLPLGDYTAKVRYVGDQRVSKALRVTVGQNTLSVIDTTTNIPGDCNVDQRITIVDFSVLAYWYGKKNPPTCVDTNKDGVINLVDFSILAFHWTD